MPRLASREKPSLRSVGHQTFASAERGENVYWALEDDFVLFDALRSTAS
jgi:hypothetical protein